MPTYSPYVTGAPVGGFIWKPKYTMSGKISQPMLISTNGLGIQRSIKLGTVAIREYTLEFETSKAIYNEIYNFLASKGFGHEVFPWKCPLDNRVYVVRQSGEFSPQIITDNTSEQEVLSVSFSLTFSVSPDIRPI